MALPPELTKKIGPLPVWAYVVGGAGVLVVLYLKKKSSASTSTTAPATTDQSAPYLGDTGGISGGGSYGGSYGSTTAQQYVCSDGVTLVSDPSQCPQAVPPTAPPAIIPTPTPTGVSTPPFTSSPNRTVQAFPLPASTVEEPGGAIYATPGTSWTSYFSNPYAALSAATPGWNGSSSDLQHSTGAFTAEQIALASYNYNQSHPTQYTNPVTGGVSYL